MLKKLGEIPLGSLTCCKNVGGTGPFKACGAPPTYWYVHNGNLEEGICSFCDQHNYVCGKRVVQIPCAVCQEPQLIPFDMVEELTGYLHCDKCFTPENPVKQS